MVSAVHDGDAGAPRWHVAGGCGCPLHARRLFGQAVLAAGAAVAVPAWSREGVEVGKPSQLSKLISPEQIEKAATEQYTMMLREAAQKRALGPESHPQVQRLRTIAQRVIPYTYEWNTRARNWRWEVNLIGSNQVNAFCMPGGKIGFYYGILDKLKLTDDEVAMIMGHEMAHALREHAREQMGKTMATRGAIEIGAALFGLGDVGRIAAGLGGQLLTLRFGRQDESEADLVGLELAARSGYDPQAGVTLWQKMGQASQGSPPEFISTHPSGPSRIRDIQVNLPKVQPLFARASKPEQRFGPPGPQDARPTSSAERGAPR